MRVGRDDFSDPVCKCSRCCSILGCGTFCPCRSKRAVGEGQGRKIRKSRDRTDHFSKGKKEGRKEPTKSGMSRVCLSGSRKQQLGRIEGRLPPDGASTGKAYRFFGKREKSTLENDEMIPPWNLFHAACFNVKDITRRTCSLHDQSKCWMWVKYGAVVDSLFFSAKFSIFITKIISGYFVKKKIYKYVYVF